MFQSTHKNESCCASRKVSKQKKREKRKYTYIHLNYQIIKCKSINLQYHILCIINNLENNRGPSFF